MKLAVAMAAGLAAILASTADAAELALKRVMLSSGGLGYFEYEAEIDGPSELTLTVKLDQVDDVLKSLVVYDDKGGIGGVTLPGREAASRALKDLPFEPEALGSTAALLRALQGSAVTVGGAQAMSGRVVSVDEEIQYAPEGREIGRRHRVSLLTERGLQQFILEQAESVTFADKALTGEIDSALARLAAGRERDARRIAIAMRGEGRRLVRAAYVVAAPMWKASYRLTLPADPAASKAAMQGWAVLENMSGTDWKDVELTLVSGRPVAFRQALYESYYIDRPEVPVDVVGRLLPRVDRGAVALMEQSAQGGAADSMERKQAEPAMAPPPPVAAPAPLGAGGPLRQRYDLAGVATRIQAEEAATQVVFRFAAPVNVPQGQTLTIPVIDRAVPAERVALYQPETAARNPLAALRLNNDGDTGLPAGVLTVYERGTGAGGETMTYVGDARLGTLPVGDRRLVSYALDQKITVEREIKNASVLSSGSIAGGVLRYSSNQQQATTYRIKSTVPAPVTLLLEQPLPAGWKLARPEAGGAEISEGRLRLPVALSAGERTVEAVIERPLEQSLALIDGARDRIAAFARAPELDAATRDRLAEVLKRHDALDELTRQVEALDTQETAVVDDQGRLRENLQSVPQNSDLARRYLAKLQAQENELDELRKKRGELVKQRDAARAALADYVNRAG